MTRANTRKVPPPKTAAEPHPSRQALLFRRAFLAGISPEDVQKVAKSLLEKAKAGDVTAARILLDRCVGVQAVEHWHTEKSVLRTEDLDERFG